MRTLYKAKCSSKWCYGTFIENGRIIDGSPNGNLKSMVKYVIDKYPHALIFNFFYALNSLVIGYHIPNFVINCRLTMLSQVLNYFQHISDNLMVMKFDIFSRKKFKCNVCGDKFKTDTEVEQHRRTAHPR